MVKKWLIPFAVMLSVLFTFTYSASAAGVTAITGSNSFDTAMPIGYWKYKNIDTTILEAGQDEAYFTFTANKGEKVYVRSTYQSAYTGMKIEIYDKNRIPVSQGTEVINPNTFSSFIYANADAQNTTDTFYVKVSRGTYTGNMYFTLSIEDRIKSGSGTFQFSGVAENKGNTSLSPSGSDSSVIKVDITNQSGIPRDAIVTRVQTTATQTPSQGNTRHLIMTSENNEWRRALVNSSTSGSYDISLSDQLSVAKVWSFKYNTLATARSTMSNVKAKIDYEYDVTKQF